MFLAESNLRLAVGVGLWCLSGSVMAMLFLSIAGPDPALQVVGVLWSSLLTAAMILLWRASGWRRWVTLVLELITIIAAANMALIRVNAAEELDLASELKRIRQSVEYQATKAAYDHEQVLIVALQARLEALPFDWVTSAEKTSIQLTQALERAQAKVLQLTQLERSSPSAGRTGGLETLSGQSTADMLELALVILLAVITEVAALALVDPIRAHAQQGAKLSSLTTSATEVTADNYLSAARTLGDGVRLAGYRVVAGHLGIGERRARELVGQLVSAGKIRGRARARE